jgi:cell shape-determining protein MreC
MAVKNERIPFPTWFLNLAMLAATLLSVGLSTCTSIASQTVNEPLSRVERRVDKVENQVDTRVDKLEQSLAERRKARDEEYKQLRESDARIMTQLAVLTEIVKRIEANQKR